MPDSIASHGALSPLAAVSPPTTPFDAESVPLALHPLPGELAAVRPRVDAARLEPCLPRSGVLALPVRSRADAVPVSATLVRSAAVRAAVVEVEMADGRRRRRRRRRPRGLVRRTAGYGARAMGAGSGTHPGSDGDIRTLTATGLVDGWSVRMEAADTDVRRSKTEDLREDTVVWCGVRQLCAKSGAYLLSSAPAASRRPRRPTPLPGRAGRSPAPVYR